MLAEGIAASFRFVGRPEGGLGGIAASKWRISTFPASVDDIKRGCSRYGCEKTDNADCAIWAIWIMPARKHTPGVGSAQATL